MVGLRTFEATRRIVQKLGQWHVFGKEQLIRGITRYLISSKIHDFNQSFQATEPYMAPQRQETLAKTAEAASFGVRYKNSVDMRTR